MMKNSMRKQRLAALAALMAVCGYSSVALADDAKADKSPLEATLEKLVKGFYGTIDVSLDEASKGMAGMVAYGFQCANVTANSATGCTQNASPKNGGAGPVGAVGFQPQVSSNKSGLGWRGDHAIGGSDTKVVIQIEASMAFTATPGLKTSYTAQGNSVTGTIGSGDTYIGIANKDWGALKAGVTYSPYKKSTDRLNPFSGMLGDYAVIMGNTGGDNRVEFGTRMDHSIWYESPVVSGFSVDALVSPGQNRTTDNVVQSAGSPDCNGGNLPGSGNLPLNCDDGGFGDAYSLALKFDSPQFYATAAYEIHKSVNRNSDGIGANNPIYGFDPSTLDTATFNNIAAMFPAGYYASVASPPYLNDIADEAAFKVGVQYKADFGLAVSAIFERMTRNVPANLVFQNERQRNGFWLAATQDLGDRDNVSVGWGHAGKTPGDPGGQHNYNPTQPNNTANLVTAAYKHRLDKQLYWYLDIAETINSANAHYDLGAGGRGLTTDCHDGTNTVNVDYSSTGPTTWGGCKPKAISIGMNYKF